MKKLSFILVLGLTLLLAACGGSGDESNSGDKDLKTIKIGASNVPHAEILEKAEPLLEEKGIKLDVQVFDDYVMPNKALDDGSIDANYFSTFLILRVE